MGARESCTALDDQRRPIRRLTATTVRSALVTAWRRASAPTSRFPLRAIATTEGVMRYPLRLGRTTGEPPATVATTELVVPRSIPMTSSPTVRLQAFQERPGLLVFWVLAEDEGQLGPRPRLHVELREGAREQEARRQVAGVQLDGAQRPAAGELRVAVLHRAAGRAGGRGEGVPVELESRGVGPPRQPQLPALLA